MQRQTKHNQRKDSFGSAVANRLDLPDYILPGILHMLLLANILTPLTPMPMAGAVNRSSEVAPTAVVTALQLLPSTALGNSE
jgi:hypothetical protein